VFGAVWSTISYSNAGKCASHHIMSQSVVWRQSFISDNGNRNQLFLILCRAFDASSTYSYSSPGTASGLLDTDIFSAGNAAGNLAEVATFADAIGLSSGGVEETDNQGRKDDSRARKAQPRWNGQGVEAAEGRWREK